MNPQAGNPYRRNNLSQQKGDNTPQPADIKKDVKTPIGSEADQDAVTRFRKVSHMGLVIPPGVELNFEEVRKRKLFAALIIPGIIILITFGVYHIMNGNVLEGSFDLIAGFWLSSTLLGLRMMKKGLVLYRINTALLGLLFLFLSAKGGSEGNKLLWMFSYPLITFYTLGIREGLGWTTTLFVLNLGILFWPVDTGWLHHYSMEFRIRFCVAFALVASMTYIYESARRKSQSSLENEQRNLETEKRKLAEMTRSVQTANRALTRSEQRLKQAQAIAQVGNFEYDPDEDRLSGSDEALRILGFDRTGPISLRDLGNRTPAFSAFITGSGRQFESECRFRLESPGSSDHPSGETIVYAKAESSPASEGAPRKIIGVVQDITAQHRSEMEKKELEAKLARSQKMEALGLLAGGVAHDLNNILSGIMSYPDMLLMRLPEDSDLKKPLSVMRDSGLKAAAIVQDLLTLARRGVRNIEVLNLNDLIDESLGSPEFQKLQYYHPEVHFNVDTHSDLLNIKGSAVHLKKTLINLVSNASEALPEGGEVNIYTRNRYLSSPLRGYNDIKAGEYIVLGVKDNGSGILPEDLSRIFEPFFTKKKMGRSGTGLGLAVVWGTVEDHNGYINVSSEIDRGTLIELFLPVTHEHLERQDQQVLSEGIQGRGERILVVDDMQTQRDITKEMLTMLGYRVETAAGGEEAIAFLENDRVDLVILDMIMEPGIDGLETFRRLRDLRPDQKTIIVSGFSETGRVKKAQQLGAGAYVKKPFDLRTIGEAVRHELER